jgi:hypothetical protein
MYTYLLAISLAISMSTTTASEFLDAEKSPLPKELESCIVGVRPGNILLELTEEQYQHWSVYLWRHPRISMRIIKPKH